MAWVFVQAASVPLMFSWQKTINTNVATCLPTWEGIYTAFQVREQLDKMKLKNLLLGNNGLGFQESILTWGFPTLQKQGKPWQWFCESTGIEWPKQESVHTEVIQPNTFYGLRWYMLLLCFFSQSFNNRVNKNEFDFVFIRAPSVQGSIPGMRLIHFGHMLALSIDQSSLKF